MGNEAVEREATFVLGALLISFDDAMDQLSCCLDIGLEYAAVAAALAYELLGLGGGLGFGWEEVLAFMREDIDADP